MCLWMPTGLPSLSSMKSSLRQLHQDGLAVAQLELQLAGAADDLLGRNAVDPLGPRPHELDAAAGDDERLEAVGAQVGEQLEHRLIDHLGVEPPGLWMFRRRDPVRARPSRTRRSSCRCAWPSRSPGWRVRRTGQPPFMSPLSSDANGSFVFHSGCCGASALTRSKREGKLEVDRLLGPQRAVVVEGGDAFRRRTKSGPPSFVTLATNATIAFFAAPSFHDGSGSAAVTDAGVGGETGGLARHAAARTSQRVTTSAPQASAHENTTFQVIPLGATRHLAVGHRVAGRHEVVAPWIELSAEAASRRKLPFRFGRQPLARPLGVSTASSYAIWTTGN